MPSHRIGKDSPIPQRRRDGCTECRRKKVKVKNFSPAIWTSLIKCLVWPEETHLHTLHAVSQRVQIRHQYHQPECSRPHKAEWSLSPQWERQPKPKPHRSPACSKPITISIIKGISIFHARLSHRNRPAAVSRSPSALPAKNHCKFSRDTPSSLCPPRVCLQSPQPTCPRHRTKVKGILLEVHELVHF